MTIERTINDFTKRPGFLVYAREANTHSHVRVEIDMETASLVAGEYMRWLAEEIRDLTHSLELLSNEVHKIDD